MRRLGDRRAQSERCWFCGVQRDGPYKKVCVACADETGHEKKKREWVEAGLCAGCGAAKENRRSRYCEWCNDARRFTR